MAQELTQGNAMSVEFLVSVFEARLEQLREDVKDEGFGHTTGRPSQWMVEVGMIAGAIVELERQLDWIKAGDLRIPDHKNP